MAEECKMDQRRANKCDSCESSDSSEDAGPADFSQHFAFLRVEIQQELRRLAPLSLKVNVLGTRKAILLTQVHPSSRPTSNVNNEKHQNTFDLVDLTHEEQNACKKLEQRYNRDALSTALDICGRRLKAAQAEVTTFLHGLQTRLSDKVVDYFDLGQPPHDGILSMVIHEFDNLRHKPDFPNAYLDETAKAEAMKQPSATCAIQVPVPVPLVPLVPVVPAAADSLSDASIQTLFETVQILAPLIPFFTKMAK
jgi:hypothetical protein